MCSSLSRITPVESLEIHLDCPGNLAVASAMPTHVIVDGYNLLGGSGLRTGQMASSRDKLLHELAAYRYRTHHAITVVFDGWQHGHPTEQREYCAGVQVIYSKRGERADQVIQRLAREYGADCAVVSSDHEIMNVARAHRAFVIGAQEFAGKLHGSLGPSAAVPHKELDPGDDAGSGRRQEKKGNPRKLPKAQRQRARQFRRF